MEVKPKIETFARIKVLGIGGSGTNAVNRMSELGIRGVEFISINTDAQALHNNNADKKVHIGKTITKGLGSGMNPDLGRQAAEENADELEEVLASADMVFVTCGLGGGTGTGAAPVVAEIAKRMGILTVAVVTRPFTFEGSQRKEIAELGYDTLKENVDAIISIHNDRILQIIDKKTSLIEAFRTVDEVLRQGIAGISDLITTHGIVNADFADIKTIMQDAGTALMGIGRGNGENRAHDAALQAINSPLLELSIDGAKGVLFNITGGSSLGMFEIDEAAKVITRNIDSSAKVKFGAVIDESLGEELRITVIATGFDEAQIRKAQAQPREIPRQAERSRPAPIQPTPSSVAGPEPAFQRQQPSASAVPPTSAPQSAPEETKEAPVRKPFFNLTPDQPAPSMIADTPEHDDSEDLLDIPAFIRKRMK